MPQYKHIVLLRFSAQTAKEEIAEIYEALDDLKEKIPGIVDICGGPYDSPEGLHKGFTHAFIVTFDDAEARAVYGFATELVRRREVSEPTYRQAASTLGLEATVDLVGILGYYTLISMTINAFHVPVPTGAAEPFADLGRLSSAHQDHE